MQQPDPTFPPLLRGIALDGGDRPFERACAAARDGTGHGGDVFWARSVSDFELAIALEPEVAASRSLQMMLALMVAFGDAFGSIGPPEIGLFYRWPGGLVVNGALVGDVCAALPRGTEAGEEPDWLIVGLNVRMKRRSLDAEPGHDLENTTLEDEGCADLTLTGLVESVSRHFLVWVHTWQEDGFGPVHDAWMARAEGHREEISVSHAGGRYEGRFVGIDDEGSMLLKPAEGESVALRLMDGVERV